MRLPNAIVLLWAVAAVKEALAMPFRIHARSPFDEETAPALTAWLSNNERKCKAFVERRVTAYRRRTISVKLPASESYYYL